MENERGKQEVLMALQGVGRLGIMMDPVFKANSGRNNPADPALCENV